MFFVVPTKGGGSRWRQGNFTGDVYFVVSGRMYLSMEDSFNAHFFDRCKVSTGSTTTGGVDGSFLVKIFSLDLPWAASVGEWEFPWERPVGGCVPPSRESSRRARGRLPSL